MTKGLRLVFIGGLLTLPALVSACGESVAPDLDLTGTWTGSATDNSGPGSFTFVLTQNDATVTGTIVAVDAQTAARLSGRVRGSLTGDSFNGTWELTFGVCTIDINFESRVTPTSMRGTYSGSNSCTGPVTNGSFQLTKQ